MLTLEDLHVARFVREQRLVSADALPGLMAELDKAPGAPGLAPRLLEQKLIEPDAMRTIVAMARRRVGLEADQAYTDVALALRPISRERLDELMTHTTTGGRIGAKLVAEGLLSAEEDAAIIGVARAKLQAAEKELLAKERAQITEAILAEPTVQIRRAGPPPAPLAGAEETVKHTAVLPLPAPPPLASEETKKHDAVLPLPGASAPAAPAAPAEPARVSPVSPEVAPPAAAPSAPPPSLTGKTLRVLSGYEIVSELGRGAMGVVYRARETQLKREVALKVLPQNSDAEATQRFIREARAIAALDHPGIVPVYQYGDAEGHYFIAMKLIDGRPLKQVAAKPLPVKRAAALIEQVAQAMAYAHGQGIVHRDLKPANILVESGDRAWVVDFGIAKLDTEMTMTQAGEIMGTPAYMSPEQAMQLPLDARTDIYSIGAVLYAIVTGQPPFTGSNAMEVLPRVATDDPPRPSAIRRDVHQDLETIILVAMAKEPERRYASALDLAEDLRRFQAGEPIAGQRPGALYLARRWARRRALPLAAAVVALAAGTGAYSLRGSRAEEEKQRLAAKESAERRERLKGRLEEAETAFVEAEKAASSEALLACVHRIGESLDAAEAIAKDDEKVVGWRARLAKLTSERATERRAAARRCFVTEGSGERALTLLKDAIALEPAHPENQELKELFKRPIVTVRWKTKGTQTVWARLDDDLHPASDWSRVAEASPGEGTFAAPETRFVRLRASAEGRLPVVIDIESKPGTILDLPAAPLETDETRSMAFVPPVPHIVGGHAKGTLRSAPERRPVAAPGFLVDRTEVTRKAFLAFVTAKGYERPELWSERGRSWLQERRAAGGLGGPKDCDLSETARGDEPVTGVSFYEAEAYAAWKGQQLPTQDELEMAARGALGGTYPWGNRYAKEFFQFGAEAPRAVGTLNLDVSPIGCCDLGGNVREWTREVKKDWAAEQGADAAHIVKGASVLDPEGEALQFAKGAAATARDPRERAPDVGFRCVRALKPGDY